MKKLILTFFVLGMMLGACKPNPNTLVGTWKVDKVNVQFDEHRATPELVKQVGEMERGNTFSIGKDSTMVFRGTDEQRTGRLSLVNDSLLFFDEQFFGLWKKGLIITKTTSPLGKVVVYYRKN